MWYKFIFKLRINKISVGIVFLKGFFVNIISVNVVVSIVLFNNKFVYKVIVEI